MLLRKSQHGPAIRHHGHGSIGDAGGLRRVAGGSLLDVIERKICISGGGKRADGHGSHSVGLFALKGHHAKSVERPQTEVPRRRLQFGNAAVNHIAGRVDADEDKLGVVDNVGHVGDRAIIVRDDRAEREPPVGSGFIAQRVGSGKGLAGLQVSGVIDIHHAAVHEISHAVENRQAHGGLRIPVLRHPGEHQRSDFAEGVGPV